MQPPTVSNPSLPASGAPVTALSRERFMMHLVAVVDAARLSRLERGLRAVGLSVHKYRALSWLTQVPSTSMAALARGAMVDRTTLSRVVDQLVDEGYVTRQSEPKDRRKVVVAVTPPGADLVDRGNAAIEATNAMIAGALEPEAVSALSRSLLRLLERFEPDQSVRDVLTGRPSAVVNSPA